MPKKLHNKLKRSAKKRGLSGERGDAYIYGTMGKIKSKRAGRGTGGRRKAN